MSIEKDLSIAAVSPKMAETLFKWRQQPNIMAFNPLKACSLEELADILAKESSDLSAIDEATSYRWAIMLDGKMVSSFSLNGISTMMGYAQIGYSVDEDMQGRGIGKRTVEMLIEKIFKETELRKLMAYVHVDNIASRKILERLGFKQEGTLREHFIVNGKLADEALYGLLKRDVQYGR